MPPQRHAFRRFSGFNGRILSFGAIGGIGFAIDAGILLALFTLGVQPLGARAISFPVAVTATWRLNKHYTFRDRPHSAAPTRYVLYVGGQIAGALINVGAFVVTIRHWPALSVRPLIPMIVGSALALLFNYTWANGLVFRAAPLARTTEE